MADKKQSSGDYAGDIMPQETWEILAAEPGAVLIDVRTQAEWSYVGNTDLSSLGKEPVNIAWKIFPAMKVNPDFARQVKAVCPDSSAALLFVCRSGIRSKDAAIAMTAQGYSRCYNVAEGFEGDKNDGGHRGTIGGWKVAGLPWKQG